MVIYTSKKYLTAVFSTDLMGAWCILLQLKLVVPDIKPSGMYLSSVKNFLIKSRNIFGQKKTLDTSKIDMIEGMNFFSSNDMLHFSLPILVQFLSLM
jgi:hypothetical protein